jgi:glycosyltransferase involved in cell wall biosynthesis
MSGVSTTISAVVPLFNDKPLAEATIRSVLRQTEAVTEVILVSDGQLSDAQGIVDALSGSKNLVSLVQAEPGCLGAIWNFGAKHATGKLIAFVEAGDTWDPDFVKLLRECREREGAGSSGWIYSDYDEVDSTGNVIIRGKLAASESSHPRRSVIDCVNGDWPVSLSTSLLDRAAFEQVGGFDGSLDDYADEDLFIRMFRAGYDDQFCARSLGQRRLGAFDAASGPLRNPGRSAPIFVGKLINDYAPADAVQSSCMREVIASRFLTPTVDLYRSALRSGDEDAIRLAREDLTFIRNQIPTSSERKASGSDFTITAIIPLYNGEKYIEEAVRSVLAQTLPPAEIIVVDDGSTDGGAAVVERLCLDYPIKLIRKENGGQSSARNRGVACAGGDLIALLDQDDAWYPNHLEDLIKPFLQPSSENLGWVYSNLDEMDERGLIVTKSFLSTIPTQHPKQDLLNCLRADMFVLPSASLISRRAFNAVGGFDERLSGYEDDDLFLRLFRAGFGNIFINEPLSKWRIYPSSSSYSFRMAKSRSIYARKLFEEYPDDPQRARYYGRDVLGPRFLTHMLYEYRKAVSLRDPAAIAVTLDDLRYIQPFLKPKLRTALSTLLALGPRAEPLLRIQSALRPIYVRLLR